MTPQPDFIVMARDTPEVVMVVEVKQLGLNLDEAERQLKTYMLHNHSPLGMLVTPESLRLYHDEYRGTREASIERIAEFSTPEVLGASQWRKTGARLEEMVRRWLEGVVDNWWSNLPKIPSIRRQLLEHLVPSLTEGRVMSGTVR